MSTSSVVPCQLRARSVSSKALCWHSGSVAATSRADIYRLLSEPTTAAQPWRREPLLMPHSRPSAFSAAAFFMSLHGHCRTPTPEQEAITHPRGCDCLFDDLVGAGEQRLRHGEAQRIRGLQVDGKPVMGRLFDRQIAGSGAPKNLRDLVRHATP